MSSGFITETEAVEKRRQRQEEWDKVRTEDQPKEVPEEAYDIRPLYQRLEEQRLQKQAEYEEAHQLKNMIRGLDDDEVGFLDLVEETKAKAAHQISLEEQKEMQDFRERVSSIAETEEMKRLKAQLTPVPKRVASVNQSQKNKLQGVIVRKRKISDLEDEKSVMDKDASTKKSNGLNVKSNESIKSEDSTVEGKVLKCIGVLPGLGHYSDTSTDSDNSSDSENDNSCVQHDLLGRRPEIHVETKRDSANS